MKAYKWLLAGTMAATLALAGCAKQEGAVDTAPLQKSFQTAADPAMQGSADKVATAIKSGDYATAMTELKSLATNAKLTPEQQQAVKDLSAQVEKAITGAAEKAKDDASKAAQDVQKSLPK